MQFTTKPLIDAAVIDQRLQSLVAQVLATIHSVGEGITMLVATESSETFAHTFCRLFLAQDIPCNIVHNYGVPTAKWITEQNWLGTMIIVQDVSSTGQHLATLKTAFSEQLPFEVYTLSVLYKYQASTNVCYPLPDWVGFNIPNEFVIGCGMGAHGLGGQSTSIQVLA